MIRDPDGIVYIGMYNSVVALEVASRLNKTSRNIIGWLIPVMRNEQEHNHTENLRSLRNQLRSAATALVAQIMSRSAFAATSKTRLLRNYALCTEISKSVD